MLDSSKGNTLGIIFIGLKQKSALVLIIADDTISSESTLLENAWTVDTDPISKAEEAEVNIFKEVPTLIHYSTPAKQFFYDSHHSNWNAYLEDLAGLEIWIANME